MYAPFGPQDPYDYGYAQPQINPYSQNPGQADLIHAMRTGRLQARQPQVAGGGFAYPAQGQAYGAYPGWGGQPQIDPRQAAAMAYAQQQAMLAGGWNPAIHGGNPVQVGMYEIGQLEQARRAGPAAASAVLGGFGAQPGLTPMVDTQPNQLRGSFLGFTSSVNANSTLAITSRPQQPFRAEKFIVPPATAPSFTISDIKIGNVSMMLNSTAAPAEAFLPNADGIHLRWITAQQGQDVIVSADNLTGAAVTFRACITGTVAVFA